MRAQLPAIAVILTALHATALAQLPRPRPLAEGTSALRGTVSDALTKAPVAGCRYFVTATGRSDKRLWVDYQPIDFIGDSIDLSLHLQPAGKIRGRIVTNRGGVPPLGESSVGAVWVDEDVTLNPLAPEESPIATDGTFEIDGLFGQRKLQLLRFDPDWRIQSVLQGRTDVTAGVEVAPNSTADVTIIVRQR